MAEDENTTSEDEDLTLEDLNVSVDDDDDNNDNDDGDVEDDSTGDGKNAATPADDKGTSESDLSVRLAELESSNKGLIKSLSTQRGLRQDLETELNGIKEILAELKSSANDDIDDTPDDLSSEKKFIPIDFDDKGNPRLDPVHLKALSSANDKITELETKIINLETGVNSSAIEKAETNALNTLLGEKEGYVKAHKQVSKAWAYLKDDLFDAHLIEKGLPAPTTASAAMDIAIGSKTITDAFNLKFPTLNMESVLEAHLIATPRYLRKALDAALTVPDNSNERLDTSKPTSLSNANTSGGDTPESLLTRVAQMSNEEYAALSDSARTKIDKLLAS